MAKPLWEIQYDLEQFLAGGEATTDYTKMTPEQQKIFDRATGGLFKGKRAEPPAKKEGDSGN